MNEDAHPPLWTIRPRWEMEYAYDWWEAFTSYFWQGAKSK